MLRARSDEASLHGINVSCASVWPFPFFLEQACLETFFGLGLIVGPTMGGFLFQMGGYTLPFMVLGVLLIAAALLTYALLPSVEHCDLPQSGNRPNDEEY